MRTVKEVSELTGISVRTLHWYDEIGLFKPTATSGAGYRLYDDKALETLQQILFFREFDMPLKEIKAILEEPGFDREQVLRSQKKMLELKRDRLNRLIDSIEGILRGENNMDFEIFGKAEIEELYQAMVSHMPEEIKKTVSEEFGGLEKYHEHFRDFASSEKGQKHYQKVMELYGDRDSMLKAVKYPLGAEMLQAYQKRIDAIMRKLAERRGQNLPVDSFEVKEVIGEYGFIMKRMSGIKNEEALVLAQARDYRNRQQAAQALDRQYGEGMAEFFAKAAEHFFGKR